VITHAILTFKTGDYDVTRPGSGSRVNGVWTEAAPAVTTGVAMAIQPIDGRDLQELAEGTYAEDYRLVLTEFALRVRDEVAFEGEQWTVYRAQPWTLRGASWTRAYISRNEVTP
jgi:hypothetical protein